MHLLDTFIKDYPVTNLWIKVKTVYTRGTVKQWAIVDWSREQMPFKSCVNYVCYFLFVWMQNGKFMRITYRLISSSNSSTHSCEIGEARWNRVCSRVPVWATYLILVKNDLACFNAFDAFNITTQQGIHEYKAIFVMYLFITIDWISLYKDH